jgi:nucleoside-diphosphate-sugar epimerase
MGTDQEIRHFYEGRVVFLTGGTGFIGSHLLRRLVQAGARVRALARKDALRHRGRDLQDSVEWVEGELSSRQEHWDQILNGIQTVFHLAAAGVIPSCRVDSPTIVRDNIVGIGSLMYACSGSSRVKRVIVAGSCAEYGDISREVISSNDPLRPTSVYGISKLASSLLTIAYGQELELEALVLRLFHTYGPGEPESRLIPTLITGALAGERVAMTAGEQVRDFCFVEDVAEAFLRAGMVGMNDQAQRVLNIGSGQQASVAEVARMVMELIPGNEGVDLGALPYRSNEVWRLTPDVREAQAFLEWSAEYSLRQGLTETIEAFRKEKYAG